MFRRLPRPLTVTAGLAALLAPSAASAAGGVAPGWQPSRPLWETQQAQATVPAAPVPPAVAEPVAPADPLDSAQVEPDAVDVPVVQTIAPPERPSDRLGPVDGGPVSGEVIPSNREWERTLLGPRLPKQQLQNLPRPYTPPAVPATDEGQPRTSVVAEELSYDDEADVVTARGNVELIHQGRVLRAQTVRYDTVNDRVTAEGEVVLMEVDGNVYFFDFAEITGDMKEGFAREATLLLADRSRTTGELMTRENNVNTMRRAIYTACDPCEDPDAAPLWRLRAARVTHDEAEKTIYYRDTWLELAGIPLFYTPYLSHPDPTVDRKSGFMPPSYGFSESLGTQITVPYYIVLDDQQDAEVALRMTSEEGPVFEGRYRGLYSSGASEFSGSITYDSAEEVRGHLNSELMWHFDETWRGGWDAEIASDGTYKRKYRYGTEAWLVSEAFLEGFSRRSYARARSAYFQQQTVNSNIDDVPVLLPELTYSFVSRPMDSGAYWSMDASAVSLMREDGLDTRRASTEASFVYPYYGSMGDVTEFLVSLRGDGYYLGQDENLPGYDRRISDGLTGRFVPTAGFSWRWPLARDNGWFREVLQPIVSAYVSPNDLNYDSIPNEDGRDFEFDVTNLFAHDRFPGWDVVESGARVNYGLQWSGYFPTGESFSALLGQTYHFDDAHPGFGETEPGLSDYVGRATLAVSPYLSFGYRFRLDQEDYVMRRQELTASAGIPTFRVGVSYLQTSPDDIEADPFGQREQVSVSANTRLSRYWSALGSATVSFTGADSEEPLTALFGLIYDDECLTVSGSISNDITSDRDYEGGTEVLFRVVFKTLGELNLGSADSTSSSR